MDERVTELHCIMPIANIASVMENGILCKELADQLPHGSIAMASAQCIRANRRIPNAGRLHQYANLYFHARNPMLYLRRDQAYELCVLRVSTEILGLDGVVIADQNAASKYVRFLSPDQWQELAWDDIYAQTWNHPEDLVAHDRHKKRKCAEVLVPARVDPEFIEGAYVVNVATQAKLAEAGCTVPGTVRASMFFR